MLIGVDPAPVKDTVIWRSQGPLRVPAQQLGGVLEELIKGAGPVWLAWDAPLSFDPTESFYDRPVDRAVRAWLKKHAPNVVSPKAVAAQPFAGCSHWAISCHVLGYPFGENPKRFELASGKPSGPGLHLFEVHPAVALAILWRDRRCSGLLPRYKRVPAACRAIATALSFPKEAGRGDDALDAYVAFHMLELLHREAAVCLGSRRRGSYLVPRTDFVLEIQTSLAAEDSGAEL